MDYGSRKEPDIFEKFGLDLTAEQKERLEQIAIDANIQSGGHFSLVELLYGLTHTTPPDHSNLNCLCSLERQARHPQTTWGHLQPRTMADPCPVCGGVDYYCAHMIDQVLSRDSKDFDAVMKALSKVYQEWCRLKQGPDNSEMPFYVARLMDAYNEWLG